MAAQTSPSYRLQTIYIPITYLEDLGVTHYTLEDKVLNLVRLLDLAAIAETSQESKYHLLHPYNSLDCSDFNFLELTDSQRKFLTQEVDYCTIRSLNLKSSLNVSPFFADLITRNQTLRALTTIEASYSDLNFSSLQLMQSKINFDGPLIRDHRIYSEELKCTVARIRVSVDNRWAPTSEMHACLSPVGVVYIACSVPTSGDACCPLLIQVTL
eukprot:gene6765-7475_t